MTNFPRLLYYLGTAMRRLYWNEAKLRRYQEKRLRSVVKHAYDFVPFYRARFKEAGIFPSDIKSLEDLPKVPIIRKASLANERPRRLISTEFDVKELRTVSTSGSTGRPFQFYLSKNEADWRKSIYMRANITCGQKPRDRWLAITAPYHFWETTNVQRRLGIYAQTCVSVFNDIDEQVNLISEAKPDVLDGYSGSILILAKEIDRRGLRTIRPRMIFGTADLIDGASSKFIEKTFEATFFDQFGCSELDRTAWQCPEKVGYHMDMDSAIMQFVDSEGTEVSAGEEGEIVYTSLFNYAMPFIRYAIGDIGVPSGEECSCGRTLPLMKVVEGRKDSMLVMPDGQLMSPRRFTVALSMFKFYSYIEQFRVIQKGLDEFEIQVKSKDGSVDESTMKTELEGYMKRMFNMPNNPLTFTIKCVEDIPLSKNGKLKSVISEL